MSEKQSDVLNTLIDVGNYYKIVVDSTLSILKRLKIIRDDYKLEIDVNLNVSKRNDESDKNVMSTKLFTIDEKMVNNLVNA